MGTSHQYRGWKAEQCRPHSNRRKGFRALHHEVGYDSFGSISEGDYTLHAKAPGDRVAEREMRVTNADEEKCSPKIDVTLGFRVGDTGTHVKGIDKPSALDSEFRKWR